MTGDYERLAAAINSAWIKAYGGPVVTDTLALETRVRALAADRACWVITAKALEREYQRLDRQARKGDVKAPAIAGDAP